MPRSYGCARPGETGGADCSLPKRQPAVVGGYFGVGENVKSRVAQCCGDALEQNTVLEGAAGKRNSVQTRHLRRARRDPLGGFDERSRQSAVKAERYRICRNSVRKVVNDGVPQRRRIELQEVVLRQAPEPEGITGVI